MLRKLINPQDGHLVWLFNKAQSLKEWSQLLKANLHSPLAAYCHVANYREGCLVIAVANPLWATRLRFEIPTLLPKLQRAFKKLDLTRIEILVQPLEAINEKKTHNHTPPLNKKTAQQIAMSAKFISNQPLRLSLLRLAETLVHKVNPPSPNIS